MIDELERKIIWVLNQDARKSYREIAREIGTSATAVMNTVRKLEASGTLKGYIPIVDPEHVGLSLAAIVAVRISQGKLLETQKRIAQDPRVSAVYDITGDWDSFIVGRFKDRDDLNRFVKKLLAMPHVDRSLTHLVLNVVKDEKRVPV